MAAADADDAVVLAEGFNGVPYRYGGTDPTTGLDCSGLTQLVFARLGVNLGRTTWDQVKQGQEVDGGLAAAKPGDLLFFGADTHHVGIYAGGGQMVDAPHTGSVVGVHKVRGYGAITAIRRLLPGGGDGVVGAVDGSSSGPGTSDFAGDPGMGGAGGAVHAQTVGLDPTSWIPSLLDGSKRIAFMGLAGVLGLALVGYGVATAAKGSK